MMSQGANALPKPKVRGVVVVKDARGWVKLSPHMHANPQDIRPEIRQAMPAEQYQEIFNGSQLG